MDEFEQLGLFDEEFPKYQINKPIRLIEAFAGIGAQSMALKRMGVNFEPYRVIEFDEFAIKSYNSIHGTNFPTIDIRNFHASDLGITEKDKYEYIMFYSFPCFTADTLVLTNSGYKKIIDVKAGDYVLTHTNKWQKVINFFDNGKREILKLHLSNIPNIKCTLNHKFYACNFRRKTKTTWKGNKSVYLYNAIIQENEGWKEAKDLKKNDFVLYPVIEDEIKFHTNNEDFWFIVGRYVADGCVRKGNFNRKIKMSS